ncbi:hypothetical protein FPOAC2_08594 [Fusarium poae]|uniref:hypothetical protein n=1 Tax=Fusarium poae TaxID=36050 RepID=UPI001CE7773C|nr:hypothetical protein FPOAC1_008662 [Fusarium poae]KAG8669273.1 hypothetical protein FPOAC1_008662 [Fusarium poae]
MRVTYSRILLLLLIFSIGAFIGTIHALRPLSNVIKRFPGDSHSSVTREKARQCNADDPASWGYAACSTLIRCILGNLEDILKSDLAIGTTILGLVPSILIIGAAQPGEIVHLALVSPHRALAVSIFGVALSPSLFKWVTPLKSTLREYSEKTWEIELARFTRRWSWKHMVCKALADLTILGMASIALWQNWNVNSAVMVQWLCESPLMIFTWPLANMTWVIFSVLLLHSMAKDIRFQHISLNISYNWREVLLLPYTLDVEKRYEWKVQSITVLSTPHLKIPYLQFVPTRPAISRETHTIRIIVNMSDDQFTFKWQVYFFIIEICAIGIYFYATFVLLSAVFIGAVGSVRFGATMAALYAVIRFIQCIF